jgi:hypothetical protein
VNIYFLALFNYSSIKGDLFTIGILFGFAEFVGNLLGEPVMAYLPDWIGLILSTFVVMVCSVLLKMDID